MEVQKHTGTTFYSVDPKTGKISLSYVKVIMVLSEAGFCRIKVAEGDYVVVRSMDNRIRRVYNDELIEFLRDYLLMSNPKIEVFEILIQNINSLIQKSRLSFLSERKLESDMDNSQSSRFYFKNKIMLVEKDVIKEIEYSTLKNTIWENRIRSWEIGEKPDGTGQFESFCFKISGSCTDNFQRLQSIIGYLLHRYKNPALTKAVLLYDSKMKETGLAEGRTGKTLVTQAIGLCREIVTFDGKNLKENSNFQFQKIELTTDLMLYDDVQPNFNFSSLFALITTSIEIERKGKSAFDIPYSQSPKVLITSNTYVKGPGGSSDRGRRCEFELANVYSDKFSPVDDFGNKFFEEWDAEEWDLFYYFMMECVQVFLSEGIIEGNQKENAKSRLENLTSKVFVEAVMELCDLDEWIVQQDFVELLQLELPDLSPHMFTKWMKLYCSEMDLTLEKRNSGSVYSFKLCKN
ncbi:hypothetical protein DET49_102203 [Salegentibacter sp. 24]|uniref:primase-helicase family protein n=1 Tax=Salegentibacter sp. 24 TaxID=2183986 RepID=UPI001060381A|nr:primase-helicase family protein [Salegentibacter sp. 24]TDN95317.1 hypothetical protein DET49_102203 [Salegentibacter sp. 24]